MFLSSNIAAISALNYSLTSEMPYISTDTTGYKYVRVNTLCS